MQYNKYILAFALLASSALVSAAPDFVKIADTISKKEDLEKLVTDGIVTAAQKTTLETDIADYSVKTDVADKIKAAYENKIAEEVKAITAIAETATGKKVSSKASDLYDATVIKGDGYKAIAEYEYKSGVAMTDAQIKEYVEDKKLPAFTDSLNNAAKRILKVAGTDLISKKKLEDYPYDLDADKLEVIRAVETAGFKFDEGNLTQYLDKKDFPAMTIEQRVAAVMDLSSKLAKVHDLTHLSSFTNDAHVTAIKNQETAKKIDADLLKEILTAKDDELAKYAPPPPPVDVADEIVKLLNAEKKLTEDNRDKLVALKVEKEHIDKLIAAASLDKDSINTILKSALTPPPVDVADEIVKLLNAEKKLTEDNRDKLVALKVEKEHIDKLIAAASLDKDSINTILKSALTAPVDPDAELRALAAEIEAAIPTDKNYSDIPDEALAKITKLTQVQKDALKTANPKKGADLLKLLKEAKAPEPSVDLTEMIMKNLDADGKLKEEAKASLLKAGVLQAQIEKLVAAGALTKDKVAEIMKPVTSNVGGSTTSNNNGSNSTDTQFYQQPLFIGLMVLLGVGVIGGGIFMMTRKNEEETDL